MPPIGMPDRTVRRLIARLQCTLPLGERRFADTGRELGLADDTVLDRLHHLLWQGVLGHFGPLIAATPGGDQPAFAALQVPATNCERCGGAARLGRTVGDLARPASRADPPRPGARLPWASRSPNPASWACAAPQQQPLQDFRIDPSGQLVLGVVTPDVADGHALEVEHPAVRRRIARLALEGPPDPARLAFDSTDGRRWLAVSVRPDGR